MGNNIVWPLEAVARLGAGASGGESADTSETFAADTSGAPVTITLPALDGLEDGYLVRVYDSGSNASTNNVTINDADDVEVDVIDEDDGERWLVVVGGAWEVRGYLPVPAAQTYLHQLAVDAGAKHVWFGPDDPLVDLVGTADLSLTSTGDGAPPIPLGVRGLLSRGGSPDSAGASAANVTIHKNADRSGIYLFRLDAAPSGHNGVMALGVFNSSDSGPAITANSGTGKVRFWDHNWGAGGTDLFNYAAELGKWCMLFWAWNKAAAEYSVYWRMEDAAEQSSVLAATVEGANAVTVYAGAQGSAMNTVTAPFHRGAFALADGDVLATEAFRTACYAALSWA